MSGAAGSVHPPHGSRSLPWSQRVERWGEGTVGRERRGRRVRAETEKDLDYKGTGT